MARRGVPVIWLPDHVARQRARILRAVQRAGDATQHDLTRALHLSASSVSLLCRQLHNDGILGLAGTDARGIGRPVTPIRLAAAAGSAVGVDLAEVQSVGRWWTSPSPWDRLAWSAGPRDEDVRRGGFAHPGVGR